MADQWEVAYAAGVLEGEGSFGARRHKGRTSGVQIWVALDMTDRDVVERVAATFGVGSVRLAPARDRLGSGESYIWRLDRKVDCVSVMSQVLPYMGARRSARISEILAWCRAEPMGRSTRDKARLMELLA